MLVKYNINKMKKFLAVVLILVVIKCFAFTKTPVFNTILLNDNEVPFEGSLSVLIAVGIIYGAKVGRKEEDNNKYL